ncbi:MAG: hypothetical protein JWR36_169 [Glaciihabitans sp.]|jgi:hypothetical protein|nr:hypothetical protein [Glaciihabitans sp.]MDQ1570262.1 hypothetical protein [Actinomycetota bacterium]
MSTDDAVLARLLPGGWLVAATNIPAWLTADRVGARYTWEVLSKDPLVLADDVSYDNPHGATQHILGIDTEVDGGFVWRGRGLQRFSSAHWSVIGVSDDSTLLTLRFSRSRATQAGVSVLLRVGTRPRELRAMIAHDTARFGLTPEDFATLTWIDRHASTVGH